jgi:chromosome segregation ATPase
MALNAVGAADVSASDFQALEEKVYRTIELLKAAREAKTAVERDAARLREQMEAREEEVETLRNENVSLRREREEVRGRVEKMLRQIDAITASESE